MTVRAGIARALFLTAGLAACDGEPAPDYQVRVSIRWNDTPASSASIGYRVNADVSRPVGCAPAPADPRVMVNDTEAHWLGAHGECERNDTFTVDGILEDAPITIRLFHGERAIGSTTLDHPFPGFGSGLVTPADARVPAGGQVVVSVPPGYERIFSEDLTGQFYWRDVPPGVPAFYTETWAALSPDGASLTVSAPNVPGLQGRAVLVSSSFGSGAAPEGESCAGFTDCTWRIPALVGPIELEVLAPQGAF